MCDHMICVCLRRHVCLYIYVLLYVRGWRDTYVCYCEIVILLLPFVCSVYVIL